MNAPSLKQPGAFVPLAMSLLALGMAVGHAAIFGITHEADEGTAAHIFQLLMAAQVPMVTVFVVRWLPRAPRQTMRVLAVQVVAALAAVAAVAVLT